MKLKYLKSLKLLMKQTKTSSSKLLSSYRIKVLMQRQMKKTVSALLEVSICHQLLPVETIKLSFIT